MKNTIVNLLLICAVFLVMNSVLSAAYTPNSDNEVLLVLDKNSQRSKFETLHKKLIILEKQPIKLLKVLQKTYEHGKTNSNPRYIGFVASYLDKYLKTSKNDIKFKIFKARILQHDHKFDQAIVLLNSIITTNPKELNARLLRASVLLVQAKYQKARQDCYSLLGRTRLLISISCIAQVDGLTKNTQQNYSALKNIINVTSKTSELSWSYDILAQLAMQLGQYQQAEQHYRQGLTVSPNNISLLNSYADLLIKNNAFSDVLKLLKSKEHDFTVLLRLAIAEKNSSTRTYFKALFQSRLQKMIELSDFTHQREIAAFYLLVEQNTKTALFYAERNWNQQKERYDALLLLKAAFANNSRHSMLVVKKWYLTNSISDVRIEKMINSISLQSNASISHYNKI